MADKTIQTPAAPRFAFQWQEYTPFEGQVFKEPSCTIPDQSMTIPEIIAKFTRSGLVPATVKMVDNGGNVAADPESDPLDDWNEVNALQQQRRPRRRPLIRRRIPLWIRPASLVTPRPRLRARDMRTYYT